MKKVMRLLAYTVTMFALVLLFLPKVNLYYAAEGLLKEKNVYISDEDVYDSGFSLELTDAKFFFDKLELMKVEKTKISPWIVYNALTLDFIEINEGFSDFLPQDISSVKAEHVFYNPMHIQLSGESTDSYFTGDVDILKRVVTLHLKLGAISEKKYKTLLKKLTKEDGGYYYEYKF
jgi:hypothetical protein